MIEHIMQLGLSISVLCNLFTIWNLFKAYRAQSDHLDSLTKLVIMMADEHPNFKVISANVVPFKK